MSVFTPESGCSAERESVGINSRIQEFNCERAVTYRIVLSAYLFKVQPGNAQILFSENPIGSWALALLAASRDHTGAATAYQFRAESLFTCSIEQVNFVHFGRFATFMP